MWLPIRGTSDMTEATHFSQCVHDQQRRLEAEDCGSSRCAQLISGGRRRIRPPCTVPRSRSPHNVLHSPSSIRCARAQYSGFPRRYTVIRYRIDRQTYVYVYAHAYVGHEKVMEITTMWGSLRRAPIIDVAFSFYQAITVVIRGTTRRMQHIVGRA